MRAFVYLVVLNMYVKREIKAYGNVDYSFISVFVGSNDLVISLLFKERNCSLTVENDFFCVLKAFGIDCGIIRDYFDGILGYGRAF